MREPRQMPAVLATALVAIAIGLGRERVLAQDSGGAGVGPRSSLAPADFGVDDENITILGGGDFVPCGGLFDYVSHCAGLNTLPNGALITQIAFYITDEDPDFEFGGYLYTDSVDSANGDPPWSSTVPVSIFSAGAPGQTVVYEFVNVPILYRQDVEGDGSSEVVAYGLRVDTAPTLGIRFLMARVRWKRQVSPAPQSSSFNDVSVNDSAFRFIEALVASGITVGCGGGNYCPDASITNAQMAVFLVKAFEIPYLP